MENANVTQPNTNITNTTNNTNSATNSSPAKKQSNLGIYISMAIAGIIAIAVAVTAILMNLQKDEAVSDQTESTTVTVNDTNLTSGSVTATIGGKQVTYNAAYVVDGVAATISSGTYSSTEDDQAVFLIINGGSLKIDGEVEINKSGSDNFQGRGDNYSFYGINSAIVVVGEGSSIEINGATINTNVSGANAVVATNNSEAVIENTTINTTKDNSRGLHATYGGTINADSTKITTNGGSCASLATDRGSGTVVANNMTLSTAGAGSPLIYSTGNITVTNSTGTATGAQIAVVEGKNSINLNGCDFSANGIGNRGDTDNAGVMIYQSMSGDADTGTGSFTATDCTLTVLDTSTTYAKTPFFFVTNTTATIDLTGTTISFSPNQKFISALSTSEWGKSGQNGGKVELTMNNTTATNTEVEIDSISSVSGI